MNNKQLKIFDFDDVSHLPADELTALSFCFIEGSISNHRLQYVINMHSNDITNMLKKLCAEDYLESDNKGRWTIYKIKQKLATSKDKKLASSGGKKVASSEGKKLTTSEDKKHASLIDDTISFYKKNLKRHELELLILKFCKNQYIKKEELAEMLGKSEDYLRNKILPNLVKSGKLEKRYPYTHNHPEQGYKTSEDYAKEL